MKIDRSGRLEVTVAGERRLVESGEVRFRCGSLTPAYAVRPLFPARSVVVDGHAGRADPAPELDHAGPALESDELRPQPDGEVHTLADLQADERPRVARAGRPES